MLLRLNIFLLVCVRTLQAEQIKNTKTILRAYISDIDEAFIEDSAPQKNTDRQLSTKIFCGTGFNKRRMKKLQREDKR
jgi:hypothetical protein